MCSAAERGRLDSLLRRAKRLGYCSDDIPAITGLFNSTDDDFFHRVKTNSITTSSSHTCLTRLTYHISFEPALTQ